MECTAGKLDSGKEFPVKGQYKISGALVNGTRMNKEEKE